MEFCEDLIDLSHIQNFMVQRCLLLRGNARKDLTKLSDLVRGVFNPVLPLGSSWILHQTKPLSEINLAPLDAACMWQTYTNLWMGFLRSGHVTGTLQCRRCGAWAATSQVRNKMQPTKLLWNKLCEQSAFSPVTVPVHCRLWNAEDGGMQSAECGV